MRWLLRFNDFFITKWFLPSCPKLVMSVIIEDAKSQLTFGEYGYSVSAINKHGESGAIDTGYINIILEGQGILIFIATNKKALGYRVYRTINKRKDTRKHIATIDQSHSGCIVFRDIGESAEVHHFISIS